ncbi:MAG: gluconate 2-dehydrogenase subunit 3 family protein [Verrucomicrobiales bacterium]|nr:gluconate 2-dehydrogenase subunit 3 family protein [Verrucomicrobiales bacterium]
MMNRREAVERITLMLGGAIAPQISSGLMGQVTNTGPSVAVNEAQTLLLAELADVIIPTTDTPGAKAAGVEQFIIRLMRDCYIKEDQEKFYAGLTKLDEACRAAHGKGYVEADAEQKEACLTDAMKTNKAFFKQMKQLTVTGYFTSEIGATQALEYLPVPGRFEGDVPLQPGQKAWAISR